MLSLLLPPNFLAKKKTHTVFIQSAIYSTFVEWGLASYLLRPRRFKHQLGTSPQATDTVGHFLLPLLALYSWKALSLTSTQSLLTQQPLLNATIECPGGLRVVSVACGLIPNGYFNRLGRRRYYVNPHSTNDLYIVECIKRLNACLLKSTAIRCVASWAPIHPLHSPRSLQQPHTSFKQHPLYLQYHLSCYHPNS